MKGKKAACAYDCILQSKRQNIQLMWPPAALLHLTSTTGYFGGENKVPHITSNMFLFSQECFSQCFAARLFEVLTSRNAAEWGKGAARGIRRMGE